LLVSVDTSERTEGLGASVVGVCASKLLTLKEGKKIVIYF
jgi:hypothetical protein